MAGRRAPPPTGWMPKGSGSVVAESVAITRLTAPDPELPLLAGTGRISSPRERWFEATAQVTPRERALAVAEAIRVVEECRPDRRRHLFHRRIVLRAAQTRAACRPGTAKPWRGSPSPPRRPAVPGGPRQAPVSMAPRPGAAGGHRRCKKQGRRPPPSARSPPGATRPFWNPPPCSTWWARCSAISAPRRCATAAVSSTTGSG